jgi:hypothetical protein
MSVLFESSEGLKLYHMLGDTYILYIPPSFGKYIATYLELIGCTKKRSYWLFNKDIYLDVKKGTNKLIEVYEKDLEIYKYNRVPLENQHLITGYDVVFSDLYNTIEKTKPGYDKLTSGDITFFDDDRNVIISNAYYRKLFPNIKRGDIIARIDRSYRNDSIFMYDGAGPVDLLYDVDDYGSVPSCFKILEEFTPTYWEKTICHNLIVWLSDDSIVIGKSKTVPPSVDSERWDYTTVIGYINIKSVETDMSVYLALTSESSEVETLEEMSTKLYEEFSMDDHDWDLIPVHYISDRLVYVVAEDLLKSLL